MLNELRFVLGAVGKKDIIAGMTAFKIAGGFVHGFNGHLALCSPLQTSLNCAPNAVAMFNAVKQCDDGDVIHLSLTPTGKLSIRAGKFKALIDCVAVDLPHVGPEGDFIALPGKAILDAFRVLEPIVGSDANRPWSTGIMLRNGCAYATNNLIIAEFYHGHACPDLNVPKSAVQQILKIGEEPIRAQCSANTLTLYYNDGRWLRTNLLSTQWPDVVPILNSQNPHYGIPGDFFDAVRSIHPFVDSFGLAYLQNGIIATSAALETATASKEVTNLQAFGAYHAGMLLQLEGLAEAIDWTPYPRPATFFSATKKIRGAIIGAKV